MDPANLLDTFSAVDMEMWHSYNFFADENINASLKDEIKEENIGKLKKKKNFSKKNFIN
jgi:hypothetical protein